MDCDDSWLPVEDVERRVRAIPQTFVAVRSLWTDDGALWFGFKYKDDVSRYIKVREASWLASVREDREMLENFARAKYGL